MESALNEHGMQRPVFADALQRCHIFLNRKVLQDLAIWEPRTFKVRNGLFVQLTLYYCLEGEKRSEILKTSDLIL